MNQVTIYSRIVSLQIVVTNLCLLGRVEEYIAQSVEKLAERLRFEDGLLK